MTRQEAIQKGLVQAGTIDYARSECLRKVPYEVFPVAFAEAMRLAARSTQDGKRIKVYCCRFCSRMHIGNYAPSKHSIAGQIVTLQADNQQHLGRISMLENELAQCRQSRDKLRSKMGQMKVALAKKNMWRRFLSWASRKGKNQPAEAH